MIHAAWPHFREQGHGRVVVATSTSGIYGNFGQANDGAAEGGLIGLINTLATEGRKYDILANAIAPMAATRMTEDIAPPEVLAALPPAHVAPVVGYLLTTSAPRPAACSGRRRPGAPGEAVPDQARGDHVRARHRAGR